MKVFNDFQPLLLQKALSQMFDSVLKVLLSGMLLFYPIHLNIFIFIDSLYIFLSQRFYIHADLDLFHILDTNLWFLLTCALPFVHYNFGKALKMLFHLNCCVACTQLWCFYGWFEVKSLSVGLNRNKNS